MRRKGQFSEPVPLPLSVITIALFSKYMIIFILIIIVLIKLICYLVMIVSKVMPKMGKIWTIDRQYGTNNRQFYRVTEYSPLRRRKGQFSNRQYRIFQTFGRLTANIG